MQSKYFRILGYSLLAAVFYLTADLLPELLQLGLYFISERIGLPYDYFDQRSNMAYVLTGLVILLLYGGIYLRWLSPGRMEPLPWSRAKKGGFIVLSAFGIGGLSLLWLTLAERLQSGIPVLMQAMTEFNQSMEALDEGSYLWELVAVCILGPILEELMFRGLIYNSVERAFRSPLPAILLSGLLFGIWHGNLVQSVYTAVMGIIVAFVYHRTRSLWFPIGIHMVNNLLSTLPPALQEGQIPGLLDKLSVLLILPCALLYYRSFRRSTD